VCVYVCIKIRNQTRLKSSLQNRLKNVNNKLPQPLLPYGRFGGWAGCFGVFAVIDADGFE